MKVVTGDIIKVTRCRTGHWDVGVVVEEREGVPTLLWIPERGNIRVEEGHPYYQKSYSRKCFMLDNYVPIWMDTVGGE